MTGTSAPDQGGKRYRIATLYAPESGTEQGEDLILQGNNDIRHLIDPRHFTSDSIILRASRLDHIRAIGLNSFDLVINAVSDVDLNPEGLELAATICGELDVPVLNLPGAVMDTARLEAGDDPIGPSDHPSKGDSISRGPGSRPAGLRGPLPPKHLLRDSRAR